MPLRKQKNYGYIFHEYINPGTEARGYHSETLKLFYGRTHPTSIRCTPNWKQKNQFSIIRKRNFLSDNPDEITPLNFTEKIVLRHSARLPVRKRKWHKI